MSRLALLIACLLLSSSCASIVTGSQDNVRLLSNPPGARYRTNTGHIGSTPATISIPDSVDLSVTFKATGYHDAHATLPSRISGWVFGNLLFGGLIGLAIDMLSGNWATHAGSLSVDLVPLEADAGPDSRNGSRRPSPGL